MSPALLVYLCKRRLYWFTYVNVELVEIAGLPDLFDCVCIDSGD